MELFTLDYQIFSDSIIMLFGSLIVFSIPIVLIIAFIFLIKYLKNKTD